MPSFGLYEVVTYAHTLSNEQEFQNHFYPTLTKNQDEQPSYRQALSKHKLSQDLTRIHSQWSTLAEQQAISTTNVQSKQ